jgi:S1-C subfamily serine protease
MGNLLVGSQENVVSEPHEGYDPSAGEQPWPTQPVPSVQGAAAPGAGMPGEQPDAGAQQEGAQEVPGALEAQQAPQPYAPEPYAPEPYAAQQQPPSEAPQSVLPVVGQQPPQQGALPGTQVPGQEQTQGPWSYGGYGAPPMWGGVYAGPPPVAPPAPRRHWRVPVSIAASVALIAAGAGVGVGYAVWHNSSPAVSAASSGTSGGTGSGTTNGNGGTNPFGLPNGTGSGGTGTGSGGTSTGGGSSTTEGSGGPSASEVSSIAQKVDPGLVDVNSTFSYQSAEGAGTGIVLTSTGEILTNNHVIDGATSISVTDLGNGKTYTATVVGYDNSQDIAVLQLQGATGLTTADIGNSSSAAVGQAVVGIGNAGGTGGTPSTAGGSLTALNQSITASNDLDGTNEQLSGLLETNADIQAGDSGGPLVNTSGQVLGIDTAGSESYSLGSSGGDGYAIPINTAISIAQQIEAGQSSSTVHVGQTAFLGVLLGSSSSQGTGGGLGGGGANTSTVSGAQISSVVQNQAAANAGLVGGDVITSLNGQSVTSESSLSTIVSSLKVGQTVSIGYTDSSGQSHTTSVTMTSGPPA